MLLVICMLALPIAAQENPEPKPAAENPKDVVTASWFFQDGEPKQLMQVLTETYHVQFEGVDLLTEPITLITEEKKKVDLDGVLALLNNVLKERNVIARREGDIVRIIPRVDTDVQWFDIKYTDVKSLVKWLSDIYLPLPGDRPEDAARKAKLIKAHPTKSRIMVSGPKDVVAEIKFLIEEQLDQPESKSEKALPAGPPMIRRYITLEFMDAEEFMLLLGTNDQLEGRFTAALAPSKYGSVNTLIIASAEEEVFGLIAEMKKAFDVDRQELRYIRLSNADAKDVADLLSKVYPKEAPALPEELVRARRSRGGRDTTETETPVSDVALEAFTRAGVTETSLRQILSRSLSIVAVGEVTIVPDVTRNALMIYTHSRNFPKILELIELLDQEQKQVYIDVFITQVSLDNAVELGVDFTRTGQEDYMGTDFDFTLNQNVGAGIAGGIGGLSYELISSNIQTFIHALQTSGNLDIVSRPGMVATNNKQAVISLGRDVPIIKDTKVSTEGAISSTVAYTEVATKLEVTPQIHADGYVSLVIVQTVDDVSTETFQISKDFNPQVIIKRKAQTELRIKDGQTVCLGGFIMDKIVVNENGIPLLMDIPLLGNIFKFTDRQREKSEMIIFITPHILSKPQDMLRMTNQQRRESNSGGIGKREWDFLEERDELEYPRFQEPLPEVSKELLPLKEVVEGVESVEPLQTEPEAKPEPKPETKAPAKEKPKPAPKAKAEAKPAPKAEAKPADEK